MRALWLAILLVVATAAGAGAATKTHTLTRDEEKLFKVIRGNPAQKRTVMKLDPILCLVARQRAQDMGTRKYFDHTNPSGQGPNFLARRAGYKLPGSYDPSKAANNIESIAARSPKGTANDALNQWLNSPLHRTHTMAETDFSKTQTRIGVGVAHFSDAPFATYYVFLSAPPNGNPKPPRVILKSSKGKVIARTR